MSALELSTMKKFLNSKSIINMNNKTVQELREIAKSRGLTGYHRLHKADLLTLLNTPSGQRKPTPEATDVFERKEMVKSRPVVKSKLQGWYDWLINTVPKPIKERVKGVYKGFKNRVLALYGKTKKALTLQDNVEDEAKEEYIEDVRHLYDVDEHIAQQPEKDVDLTPKEHKHAFKKAYRSFRIPGIKADVDGYIAMVTPKLRTLIKEQVKDMGSAKVQLSMWIQWKKKIVMEIDLDEEDLADAQDVPGGETDGYIRIEKPFNSKMTQVFQGSDIDELLEGMFAYIKTQVEHPALPKSGFTIDRIMHLDVNFHKLQLTRGSSYITLPSWIASKKAIINPTNENDEECFKWAVTAALHHEEINNNPERISKLKTHAENYNWQGLEFPMAVRKISKFEKKQRRHRSECVVRLG